MYDVFMKPKELNVKVNDRVTVEGCKGTFIKALEVQQILHTLEMCKKHLPESPACFSVRLKNKHRCKEVEFYFYSFHIKTAKTGNEILVFKTNKAKTYIEYQYKEYNANDWFIMRMSPVYDR